MTVLTAIVVGAAIAGAPEPHAGMLRYPDVSADQIVFVYANDLWLAPREGGRATPLASPPGQELFPRFSPDGSQISFIGNYDGDRDLYTIPTIGGIPHRVTHHPANELLSDYTPDGRLLFATNALTGLRRQQELFTVSPEGGMPEKLPVPYGASGAISPDGTWLAYIPHSRDFRTWKRYRGGMATDIWLYNLNTGEARQATDFEGTDTAPMWHDSTLYYLSDAGPSHKLNIWSYNPARGTRQQITTFDDFDVKFPSVGPGPRGKGEIVFQNGPSLYLLDLATEKSVRVDIEVPGARPTLRPQDVDAAGFIQSRRLSPTGKRVLVEGRGDVWSLPATEGSSRNLTRTSGVGERSPAMSPDGTTIACFSDENAEYNLTLMDADGSNMRRVTDLAGRYLLNPSWSPDSELIAFCDQTGDVHLTEVATGKTTTIATDPWANPVSFSWSHDSAWLALGMTNDRSMNTSVWLYERAAGTLTQATSVMFDASSPAFDREGKFLYYVSSMGFNDPVYEDVGITFAYAGVQRILCAPLRDDVESPFLTKSDEEEPKAKNDEDDADDDKAKDDSDADDQPDADDDDEGDDDDADDEDDQPIVIDIAGLEARAFPLPIDQGRLGGLGVNDAGAVLYVRTGLEADAKPALMIFDPSDDEPEEKVVIDAIGGFDMSADGKKVLIIKGGAMGVVDTKPAQKMEDRVPTDSMGVTIDPRAEWKELFTDAWRRHRDYFYVANMHGVDWDAVYERYGAMLDDAVNREDVSFIIGEMIAELNVGHAYYWGGDVEAQPTSPTGLLGTDFELDKDAYRISRILRAGPWDADARSPLDEPGLDVNEGDYLLAVNGVPVDAAKDPWAALVGLGAKTVTLTVSAKPTIDDDARQVVVETLTSEEGLRYRAWVEHNRARVAELSGGKVGYIHVPNTGVDGQNELFRQFYGQRHLDALLIDERWNGGGQIPNRFIELLNRKPSNYWARRDGNDWPWPPDAHFGPKAMLINGLAGSGGDMFPWLFREDKIGPLIGMRTWGGLVGITTVPSLIDGGYTAVPTFGFYENNGTWGIEGHGVDPDIRVVDDPSKMHDGADPQLEAGVEYLMDQVATHPYRAPTRPQAPDRSGMGVLDDDK